MHDNYIGMTHVVAPLCMLGFFILLGISGYFLTKSWQGLGFLFILGCILPISIYYRDNIRSPRQIDIQEDGFLAVYRNGKNEFIPWERIELISFYQGDPTKFGMAAKSGGGYKLKSGGSYPLKGELGKDMRDAYARKMGKYPPMAYRK